ncbi:aminomethyl-transferring glycine dehydrogenase [Congregibacter litoralis]|uniref:Glycine dehydrogenase (decarboxylating) n=1 Tax=Congregibacter litoralis KT71 TaxID=314285 RepID=A4ACX5_9GAMM|nr:aminomethyl-transferring glycine dehydrogenase [Congregibacter litoralis]EAQ96166.1 glycine dehydrogenase alpha subunit/glycine dehydrogenase (decarboxylating) beta subunit [Congregibacter litoralis KT71]
MSMERLTNLEGHDEFIARHIGPSEAQQSEMALAVGYASVDALIDATVPANIRLGAAMNLDDPQREVDVIARLKAMAEQNHLCKNFIGMGYYGTHTPAVIQRNVLENPGWYTAYTPYQAEISQGRLEALLSYQQVIMDLTGMELANASMLDEASAAAEAMTLTQRVNKKNKSTRFIVDSDCHPQTLAVLQTRAEPLGIDIVYGDAATELQNGEAFGLFLQYPGSSGEISDPSALIESAHAKNTLVVVASDLLALLLLKAPGDLGADVVVGNSQRFGVPMGFGGPHAAFFATRDAYKRSTPGRIIGVSVDRDGRPALRMAMQTREQHIRREKATSNICTAQALLAVMAAFYAMYHGPEGLRRIAERVQLLTAGLATALRSSGIAIENQHFVDTLTIDPKGQRDAILARAKEHNINLRCDKEDTLGISLDETTTRADLALLIEVITGEAVNVDALSAESGIPDALQRDVDYLQHPLFNEYHSETEMLRYMRRLESKDIALNRSMIALGSCTMKLNATTEMLPVTWEGFGALHPFAPADQTRGYSELLTDLERMLTECTGYDAVSLQPNAGSQGEYAGLLVIKRYHESRGDHDRNICLIPSSAHGTNPASAVLAGMRVVIVECDALGNVDIGDLRQKAEKHSAELAAIMVTYPSTHGVFEEGIVEVCAIVHEHGGQVYVDGANLNALVGLAAPGKFGADVSHLNLHKTFCIPHGGGGPGMGPIGVGAHLQPFLPSHPVRPVPGLSDDNDVVCATPYGSASILPISWAYIALMGASGLTHASKVAIVSANYIAHRLRDHFAVLYTGSSGTVAHECIIDIRPIKEASGIGEEDIAKRLMDFGFHAPTMSFPVAGTLMIEPTESESLAEIDRFCDALITIREEIREVENGRWSLEDNPLVNAPHTLQDLTAEEWTHAYSRKQAAFAMDSLQQDKYWPPVSRIDNVYGDRNLFCACPSIDSFRESSEDETTVG